MKDRRYLRRSAFTQPEVFEVSFQTNHGNGRGKIENFTVMGCEFRILWATDQRIPEVQQELLNVTLTCKGILLGFVARAHVCHVSHRASGIHCGIQFTYPPEELAMKTGTFALHEGKNRKISTHQHFRPQIRIANPLVYQDDLHGEVLSFSGDQIEILTSARNHTLFPNQVLENCEITLPTVGVVQIRLHIRTVKEKREENALVLNGALDIRSILYQNYFTGYALRFCMPFASAKEKILAIRSAGLSLKKIRQYFDYTRAQNADDYEQVMKLRAAAYIRAKKVQETTTDFQMGDAFDLNSTIILAKMDQSIVGSVRGTFVRTAAQKFELENSITLPRHLNRFETFEVSRLCVHEELEGTDLVLGLLERVTEVGLKAGVRWVITSCVEKDFARYQMFGFKDAGSRFRLQTLQGTPHMLIVQDGNAARFGKTMKMVHWVGSYSGISDHLAKLRFIHHTDRTWLLKIRQWFGRKLYHRFMASHITKIDNKRMARVIKRG